MAEIAYQPVQDAMNKIKNLSADEEAQRLAFVRERALHDEASLLKDAKEEGQFEATISMLNRQLTKKFDDLPSWVDTKLQQASLLELEQWIDNILFAQTLDDVFQSKNLS